MNWQTTTVTKATVAGYVSHASDILLHLTTKSALDDIVCIKNTGKPSQLIFGHVPSLAIWLDIDLTADLVSKLRAYTVNIPQ